MSRIEQIIVELEDYIEDCKPIPLSSTRIAVNRDEINEYIRELRLKTPDEIKKYQKLISNKEAILADAKNQAEQMIKAARVHTEELINEHEIMQQAIEQANEVIADASKQAQQIVDRAVADADNIRLNALRYTDDMLANLQMIIEHSIEESKSKYESLINSLNKDLNVVTANRNELRPQEPKSESAEANAEEELAASVKEAMQDSEADDDGYNG